MRLRYAAFSDVGRVRKDNQDSGYAGPHLLVVADGVGGSARGDAASAETVEVLRRLDTPPGDDVLGALAGAIHLSHDRIAELVAADPSLEGTSTTVTALVLDGDRIEGPAIIEEFGSTVPVHPGFTVVVDAFGNLVITKTTTSTKDAR